MVRPGVSGLDLETPPPAPPAAPVRRQGFVRTWWRRLTMMRTAIFLLGMLALAAIPGSLFPQRGSDLPRVQEYLVKHRTMGPFLDRIDMFDVYAAPWFSAIYLLLMISLIGCLVPRTRHHVRTLMDRPAPVSARAKASHTLTVERPASEVRADLHRHLRGWRRSESELGISAGKGRLRETGNLCFHVAILVILLGIGLGSVRGFEGDRVLIEGQGLPEAGLDSGSYLTNSAAQYDALRPGRLFGGGDLKPWTMQLETFTATYQPGSTTPKDYDAVVRWHSSDDNTWHTKQVKVNDPLDVQGDKVYLLNHGYAPVFRLKDSTGKVVSEAPVICPTIAPAVGLSNCVWKVGDLPRAATGEKQDLGFRMTFAPTGVIGGTRGITSVAPELKNPDVLVTAWVGDLGLDSGAPQSVYALDTTLMKQSVTGNIDVNSTDPEVNQLGNLPGGYTLDVAGIQEWASFRVKRDPGKTLVLFGAIIAITGVATSLSLRRRRLWIRLRDDGPRTLVEVGAQPRSERDREAADRDVQRLVQHLHPEGRPL